MTDNKLFNVFVNANKTAYYEYFENVARSFVKDLRNANVDMYYLNQAEKFAACLRFVAKDDDVFGLEYFNNKVKEGIDQINGWVNNDFTPDDVRTASLLFLENIK